jgi:glutamate--cysteine ligase
MPQIVEQLAQIIVQQGDKIEQWFETQYQKTPPFFYSSVDLRHSGHKLVPVDTNLFPAGFNLLSQSACKQASEQVKSFLSIHKDAKNVLIVPENHTRNLFYLENVKNIQKIITEAGFNVRIGSLIAEEVMILETQSGKEIILEPLIRDGAIVKLNDFTPDVVIVNNDFSAGAPDILHDIDQPIYPPVGMGWYRRRKTTHFDSYAHVSHTFATDFGIDEWLISSIFSKCGAVNFKEQIGLECVARNVDRVLHLIAKKYEKYGIQEEPYVFIKADSGTYGMGIMTVKSADEVLALNKKSRNKMNAIKEGAIIEEVIIQEGIPTIDMVDGKVSEPMIYLVNGAPIGCTMRINENRDDRGNLNSSGMTFKTACGDDGEETNNMPNGICPAQGLIARLAALACTRECYEDEWTI